MTIRFFKILIFFCYVIFFAGLVFAEVSVLKEEAADYRAEAVKCRQAGDIDKAIVYCQKSLLLDNEEPATYNELGILYEHKGQLGRAEKMYLAAITENSLYLPAHNNLAYLYELQNKIDKAVTHWKIKAEFSKKDDEWAKKAIAKLQEYGYGQEFLAQKEDIVSGRVIQEGELFDIREISELESKSKPYNPLIDESNQRKIIYFGNDVFDQIQSKDIQKPVEKYKRHMVKGKIYYMKQDYKKSLSEFEEAYNLQPTEESKGWIDKIKEYIKQQQ